MIMQKEWKLVEKALYLYMSENEKKVLTKNGSHV